MSEDKYEVLFMQGVEGPSIYINDYRICGNKPWGGGTIGHKWQTTLDSIINAIPALTALRKELEEAKGFERDESERRSQMYSALLRVASSLNYFDAVRIAEEAIKKDREL
jgi:hypothetical protein